MIQPNIVSVREALAQSGLVPIDAHVLLAHVLGRNRAWLAAHADDALGPEHAREFFVLAKRRRAGEPIAYLTGMREFWGMELAITPAVLIPRPETETLVEVALAHLPEGRPLRVLDLGTGSGAVALALARERPRAEIVATDVSPAALEVARANGARLGVANVAWVLSDWYQGLDSAAAPFDAVVSNPPYVEEGDEHMEQGDLRFEPQGALTPGVDSLLALRRVIDGARSRLVAGGIVAVEHGYDQAEAVRALFRDAGLEAIATARDIAGVPRVTSGRKPAATP